MSFHATTLATLAASTKLPWMTAHRSGWSTAAWWLYTCSGAMIPMAPWCATTYPMATRNGSQSWYRVMIPTITKKWKWASMVPPERCTSTAEDVTSPMAHMAELKRRCCWPAHARMANTPMMAASLKECRGL